MQVRANGQTLEHEKKKKKGNSKISLQAVGEYQLLQTESTAIQFSYNHLKVFQIGILCHCFNSQALSLANAWT